MVWGEPGTCKGGLERGCTLVSLPSARHARGASGLKVCLWVCLGSVQSFLETEGRVGWGMTLPVPTAQWAVVGSKDKPCDWPQR